MEDLSRILNQAIGCWFPREAIPQVHPKGGGLSGGRVWKVEVPGEHAWGLRCWPSQTPAVRVEEVHRVLQRVRDAGCMLVPEYRRCVKTGSSWCEIERYCWDCAEWIVGDSGTSGLLALELGEKLAAAAAQWSAAAGGESRQRNVPAIAERLERIDAFGRGSAIMLSRLREAAAKHPWSVGSPILRDAVEAFASAWSASVVPQARSKLVGWRDCVLPVAWVIRDCHAGNAVFSAGQLLAWVDFDALRVDSPAVDLARIYTSILGDEARMGVGETLVTTSHSTREKTLDDFQRDEVWRAIVQGYRRARSLAAQEEELARLLAAISPLLTLGNWLVWLLLENRTFSASPLEILQRLGGWVRVVQR